MVPKTLIDGAAGLLHSFPSWPWAIMAALRPIPRPYHYKQSLSVMLSTGNKGRCIT